MLSCIFELYDYPACCHSSVCWSKSWSVSGRTRKPCSIMFTLDSWHLLSKSSAKTLRPRLQNSWHHSGCSDDSNSVHPLLIIKLQVCNKTKWLTPRSGPLRHKFWYSCWLFGVLRFDLDSEAFVAHVFYFTLLCAWLWCSSFKVSPAVAQSPLKPFCSQWQHFTCSIVCQSLLHPPQLFYLIKPRSSQGAANKSFTLHIKIQLRLSPHYI